jgi:predicted deacetylase
MKSGDDRPHSPALVVSLHDVSPMTRNLFTAMLAELAAFGVKQTSLLVIPDHHHRGHMLADTAFCRWLESLAAQGHELVVHGYYHDRPTRPGESWWERGMTRIYTRGEGEFYDLPGAEAAERLAAARAEFSRLAAPAPVGFIAPAWLLGAGALAAVRMAGFRYTTSLTGTRVFREARPDEFTRARALVYSCRNPWRRAASLWWNAGLARRLRRNPLQRLSLHPPDYQHANIWQQVRGLVQAALPEREAMTYRDYLGVA